MPIEIDLDHDYKIGIDTTPEEDAVIEQAYKRYVVENPPQVDDQKEVPF